MQEDENFKASLGSTASSGQPSGTRRDYVSKQQQTTWVKPGWIIVLVFLAFSGMFHSAVRCQLGLKHPSLGLQRGAFLSLPGVLCAARLGSLQRLSPKGDCLRAKKEVTDIRKPILELHRVTSTVLPQATGPEQAHRERNRAV